MSADIWMPLYIGDYLADTRRLNTEEHGAYLLLIMDYWKQGPPPDDDCTLARIVFSTVDNWKRIRATVESFFEIRNGKWTHKRIDRELVRARENSQTYHARAKIAAAARWDGKHASSNASSNASSKRQAMLESCPPSPSPSPTPPPSLTPRESRRFAPPSLEEVKLNGAKIGLPDSECVKFFSYYASNGWKVGRNGMKCWRAAMTHWRGNWRDRNSSGATHSTNTRPYRTITDDALRTIENFKPTP